MGGKRYADTALSRQYLSQQSRFTTDAWRTSTLCQLHSIVFGYTDTGNMQKIKNDRKYDELRNIGMRFKLHK